MNSEIIKIFCSVYNIPDDSEYQKDLLSFYKDSKRLITEQEFRFVYSCVKKYESTAKYRLSSADCSSDAFRELLSDLIKRYNAEICGSSLPILTDLAEYAARGTVKQEECGIFADSAYNRTVPTIYSGSSESFEIGDILLTLSYGKPIGGKIAGDICAILSPSPNQTAEDFIDKAKRVCIDFAKAHPQTLIKAATNDGLLSDLAFLSDGYIIDTRLLPSPGENIEDIFNVTPPAILIFPKREDLHELWMTSAIYGLTPTAPIASRAKSVTIRSGATSIEFTKDEISRFNKTKDLHLESRESPCLGGETEIIFNQKDLKYSSHQLTAIKLGGDRIYEALEEVMTDKDAVYAICGGLGKEDPSLLPLIITLDSFRRNTAPNVIYSRFFMGETTSLYVFKLTKKK